MASQDQTAEDFLEFAHKFKLGCLLTEQQNPKTVGLSEFAQKDLPKAIAIIKELDVDLVDTLKNKLTQLEDLYRQINDTLEKGGRIFICGCGATGRLSIVLETLWRQETGLLLTEWSDRVVAFMAGGDAALIKSIEDFEDHPQFAEQQVVELGFGEEDLMIGSTEGGETSWVIGAVWKATKISCRKPFILYGNTDEILVKNVERSREFIESPQIRKINCNVGYMALAGSTRMQSTTILMYAIGLALLGCDRLRNKRQQEVNWRTYAQQNVSTFEHYIKTTDFSPLSDLIERQAELYAKGELLSYCTDSYYGVSILTDTTERSPTFSLAPFKNKHSPHDQDSWCNLNIIHQQPLPEMPWEQRTCADWTELLGHRALRGLNSPYWHKYHGKVTNPVILGFGLHEQRDNTLTVSQPFSFCHRRLGQVELEVSFPGYPSDCRLSHHCVLKVLLNSLSTIVMGRLGRYSSNIMTYVKPTNYKLIDRAARYVVMLRPQSSYEQAVRAIYKLRGGLGPNEPIVLKVIEYLNQQQ